MNANARRHRATIRRMSAETRAAAKIRRQGAATLSTYGIAAGLTPTEARTVAGSLRKGAVKLGVTGVEGVAFRKGRRHACRRYAPADVAAMAATYRPRKAAYVAAKARLALAA